MKTWSRKELKKDAKEGLKRNYAKAVVVGIITAVIAGGTYGTTSISVEHAKTMTSQAPVQVGVVTMGLLAAFLLACAIKFLLFNPLEVGCNRFFHRTLEENAELKEVGYSYKKGCSNSVKILFLRDLYIGLWSILFVIPGIVKTYEYRMLPYILSENPHIDRKEAFALSKEMMMGNKWRAFVLDLSFILWDILGTLSFGILDVFYVIPYKRLTTAALYRELKTAAA